MPANQFNQDTYTKLNESYQRSRQSLFKQGEDLFDNDGTSFFDPTRFIYESTNKTARIDDRYTPHILSTIYVNNPLAFGILNKVQDLILSREYGFFGKDEKKNILLKKMLDASGFEKRLIQGIIPAFWGTGGGNVLYYTVKNNGRLEIRAEPFVTTGFQRIQVKGSLNNAELDVQEYEVIDSNRKVLYKFKPDKVYHLQYSAPDGNYMFGSSPIITLAKFFMTHLKAMAASESVFEKGLQASYLVGLDATKMAQTNATIQNIAEAEKKLKEELKQVSGLRGRNSFLYTGVPMTMQKIQMSNVEMETIKLMQHINQLTYIAYGVDQSVLDISTSKYDNVDKAMDQLYVSIRSKLKRIIKAEMEYVMPRLYPLYDAEKYPLRMAYEPTQESMELKRIKQEDMSIFLDYFIKAKEIGLPVKPTPSKVKELQELGLDVTAEVAPAQDAQSPQDFLEIADTFTNVTKQEEFSDGRSVKQESNSQKMFENMQGQLDDMFSKILDYET